MYLQITIVLFLLISVIGIRFWFFRKNRALLYIHNQNVLGLESKISINRFQIDTREHNLSKYDFLKYNLDKVLVVQLEIQS